MDLAKITTPIWMEAKEQSEMGTIATTKPGGTSTRTRLFQKLELQVEELNESQTSSDSKQEEAKSEDDESAETPLGGLK